MDKTVMDNMTLEQTFAGLEEVIQKMERGDISLEDSFKLYHEGIEMLKSCNDKIDKIEKQMLILDEGGTLHEFK